MKRFKQFINESENEMKLDTDFMRRAAKVTSFNLTAADFNTSKYKDTKYSTQPKEPPG
jgi:hypothetical protein